jgi:alpha-glucosidase
MKRNTLLSSLALVVSLIGCGGSGDETTTPPKADAATDANQDAPVGDASDAADVTTEMEADAIDEPEGSSIPVHCAPANPLPAWAEASPEGNGLTVRCSGVDLRVDAWDDGMLRLRYVAKNASPPQHSWAVFAQPDDDQQVYLSSSAGMAEVCTRWMVARVEADTCRLLVEDTEGHVLIDDGDQGGWSQSIETNGGESVTVSTLTRNTPSEEQFYGFGERNGRLGKRGERMTFWNTDPYDSAYGGYAPDADPLYLGVPFYVGLRADVAYGTLTDVAHRVVMDVASDSPSDLRIDAHTDAIDQVVVAGPSMDEVLRRYSSMSGRQAMPPRWALGYHQCRWGYSPASAFEAIGQQFRDRAIPADGLWLDIQHMDGFRTFTWDPNAFADPAGMILGLADRGFKVTVIADPGIKVDPGWDVYDSGIAGDHFLKLPSGELFTGTVWPGEAVFPDLTAGATRQWWAQNIGGLVGVGVRGIWLDVNEPTVFPESGGGSVPDDIPVDGDGTPTTMAEAHNIYALNEARATYEGMRDAAPSRRPFILTRAGFAGTQRYAAVWTGDGPSTWTTLRQTLPMLLNLGLSGLPFAGSDVGGYSGGATPELFARWMGVGAVSPFFRGHVTSGVNDQEPWAFGQEVEDISRQRIHERYELLPYFYSVFDEARRTGAPILRPMVYAFQDDPAVRDMDDQAMVGPSLLVAPILEEGATDRVVYLPEGRWYEVNSSAAYDGPTTVTVGVTLAAVPTYVREGSIIPRAQRMQWSDEQPIDPLRFDVYPGSEPSTFTLYEDGGDGFEAIEGNAYSRVTYSLEQTTNGARLTVSPRDGAFSPPSRTSLIRFHRVDHGATDVRLAGASLTERGTFEALEQAGEGWWWDERDLSVVVAFPDATDTVIEADYDTSLSSMQPPVAVRFEVLVPAGTPIDPPVHISLSSDGWSQQAMTWTATPNVAEAMIEVPRGTWFFYKYTRGDWDTVEKWPACEEAEDRYGFGQAYPARVDEVFNWRDWCGG